jgi:hypothetical protein
LLQDVGVDHGRDQIVVPEQSLNGTDGGAALEEMGRQGMATGVGADGLCQIGMVDGYLGGFIDDAGVDMIATCDPGMWAYGEIPGGEDVLPSPFLSGCGAFLTRSMPPYGCPYRILQ